MGHDCTPCQQLKMPAGITSIDMSMTHAYCRCQCIIVSTNKAKWERCGKVGDNAFAMAAQIMVSNMRMTTDMPDHAMNECTAIAAFVTAFNPKYGSHKQMKMK